MEDEVLGLDFAISDGIVLSEEGTGVSDKIEYYFFFKMPPAFFHLLQVKHRILLLIYLSEMFLCLNMVWLFP